MTAARKWLAGLAVAAVAVTVMVTLLLRLVPSDAELAQRIEAALSDASGVKVSVGAVRWQLRPLPVVVVDKLVTDQPQPVALKKLNLYPDISALWQRRIKLDLVELEGAVVPQQSLRGLGGAARSAKAAKAGEAIAVDAKPANAGWTLDDLPVSRYCYSKNIHQKETKYHLYSY